MRVLVVDDVASARRVIRDALEEDPEIKVVGEAADGEEAVALAARLRPDVITMDVLMPVLDGYAATAQIMAQCPTPVVAVTSLSLKDGSVLARMLAAGAVDIVSKAFSRDPQKWRRMRRELVARVRAAAQVRVSAVRVPGDRGQVSGPDASDASAAPHTLHAPAGPQQVRVVVVAASTGGPAALEHFLAALQPGPGVPVLVVQHIARGFTEWLAGWLSASTGMPVEVARAQERALADRVYLAPDDQHLLITAEGEIRLNRALPIRSLRPSADVLFRSAAQAFGAEVVGVVLTGMGNDGTEGARWIKDAGGRVLAQDEHSSAIFGMPRSVIEAGLADGIYPPDRLAQRLRSLCRRESGS